jgi:hypothetical protein
MVPFIVYLISGIELPINLVSMIETIRYACDMGCECGMWVMQLSYLGYIYIHIALFNSSIILFLMLLSFPAFHLITWFERDLISEELDRQPPARIQNCHSEAIAVDWFSNQPATTTNDYFHIAFAALFFRFFLCRRRGPQHGEPTKTKIATSHERKLSILLSVVIGIGDGTKLLILSLLLTSRKHFSNVNFTSSVSPLPQSSTKLIPLDRP